MVLDGLVQSAIIVIIIITFLAIVNAWIIGGADRTFFDLLIKLPKFVDKSDATLNDYNFNDFTTTDKSRQLFATYNSLKYVSIFIIGAAVVIGMIIFLGEEFGIQKKGTAIETISNSFFYLVLLMFFPLLWDVVAAGTETLNIYILNPADPTPDAAAAKAKELFLKLGGINTEVNSGDYVGKFFSDLGKLVFGDPGGIIQSFHDLMTSVFRAFMAALIFLTIFIVGTMRMVMTATIIAGLPVILAIKLIPWIRKPADRLLDTLYGLVVATVISSVVIVAGTAYLDTMPKGTLEQNFQATIGAVGVILLAVLMPVMLSPMLGSIITSVTGMATTALAAGITAAGAGVAGAGRGAMAAIGGGAGQVSAMTMGGGAGWSSGGFGSVLAKAAMAGLGSAGRSMGRSFGDFASQLSRAAISTAASGSRQPGVVASVSAERDVGVLSTAGIRTDIAPAKAYDYRGGAPIYHEEAGGAEPARKVPGDVGMRPIVTTGSEDFKPDYTTLDDSVASAVKDTPIKSASAEPLSSLFRQLEESKQTETRQAAKSKIHTALKGAAAGALAGVAHGTLKGMGSLSSSYGMGDLKIAGKASLGWLDASQDGRLDINDATVVFEKIKSKIDNYIKRNMEKAMLAEASNNVVKERSEIKLDIPDAKKWTENGTLY
jgi:hypothetical protein